jgi:hypothetical protein
MIKKALFLFLGLFLFSFILVHASNPLLVAPSSPGNTIININNATSYNSTYANFAYNQTLPAQLYCDNNLTQINLFKILNIFTGSVPTVSNCGISPSINSTSLNSKGTIYVGTGISVTSCELDFASPYFSSYPVCIESDNSLVAIGDIASVNQTSVVFGLSASLSGGTIYYHCF